MVKWEMRFRGWLVVVQWESHSAPFPSGNSQYVASLSRFALPRKMFPGSVRIAQKLVRASPRNLEHVDKRVKGCLDESRNAAGRDRRKLLQRENSPVESSNLSDTSASTLALPILPEGNATSGRRWDCQPTAIYVRHLMNFYHEIYYARRADNSLHFFIFIRK